MMRKLFLTALAAVLLSACAPVFYYAEYEKMAPSPSGVDLVGRKVVVATRDSSAMMQKYVEAFAGYLEQDYGSQKVKCCQIQALADSVSLRQQMVSLAMAADGEVVFYLQSPTVKTLKESKTARATFHVYDVFSKEDTVYTKNYTVNSSGSSKKLLSTESLIVQLAEKATEQYQPVVNIEHVPFATYEGDFAWADAATKATEMKLEEAIKAWAAMLETKNLANKAALELNIASALYVQGRFELAKEWLELSKQTCVFEETAYVEKLITKALK